MSSSISISEHVKLTDKQEQVIKYMRTFKEPLEGCQRILNRLLFGKSKHCHGSKTSQKTEQNFEVNTLHGNRLNG